MPQGREASSPSFPVSAAVSEAGGNVEGLQQVLARQGTPRRQQADRDATLGAGGHRRPSGLDPLERVLAIVDCRTPWEARSRAPQLLTAAASCRAQRRYAAATGPRGSPAATARECLPASAAASPRLARQSRNSASGGTMKIERIPIGKEPLHP